MYFYAAWTALNNSAKLYNKLLFFIKSCVFPAPVMDHNKQKYDNYITGRNGL